MRAMVGAFRSGFADADRTPSTPAFGNRGLLRRRLRVAALRLNLALQPRPWLAALPAAATSFFDRIGRLVDALNWRALRTALGAIRWWRIAFVASAPFVLPAEWRAALVRLFAYLGAIGALSLIAAEFVKEPARLAVPAPTPRPDWTEVDKPWPAFELAAHGAEEPHYAIRRHARGGGRKDILSFGELGLTQSYFSVEIYRPGQERGAFERAADAVHALASEHGRVVGLRSTMPIASKFGVFRAFEFAIGPFGGYHCVGFQRAADNPRVQIAGLSCNMKLIVDRGAISCALDRLSLLSAGSDPDIAKLFAQAELKRSFCGQRDPLMYATPKRPGSDLSSTLKLRGRIAR